MSRWTGNDRGGTKREGGGLFLRTRKGRKQTRMLVEKGGKEQWRFGEK
jgi:hypothetical protein